MTAKTKADELIDKFMRAQFEVNSNVKYIQLAVKSALITVEQCINASQYNAYLGGVHPEIETVEFWQEVKKELELLIGGSIN